VRLAGEAWLSIIGDGRLTKAHPRDHSSHEAARLAKGPQREHDAPAHQPKVACVDRYVDADHGLQKAIKNISGRTFENRLSFARSPHAVHDVVTLSKSREHLGDDLRRVLQVGIHHHHRLAARVVEAGSDGELVSEIARQRNHPVARLGGAELLQSGEGTVARPVVDEDHFPGGAHRSEEFAEPAMQLVDGAYVKQRPPRRQGRST